MALDPTLNFSKGTLSTGYDDAAVEVVLESGHGAKFPEPAATGAFNVVWYNSIDYADPSDDPNVEIVRVTARTTDTLTILRAQESTTAKTHNTANKTYKIILGPTAKTITDLDSVKANLASPTFTGTVGVPLAQFNTNPTVGDFSEGKLYYDTVYKTLSCNIDTDVNLQIGQETMIRVINNSAANILNGEAVYLTGASGVFPTVAKAIADADATSYVLGIATQNINIGAEGFVTCRGVVRDLNTNAFNAGDNLYLSGETAGALQNTVPPAPYIEVRVGRVVVKNDTAGSIFVNTSGLRRLTDLSDVTIASPSLDQFLRYNGVEWINGPGATSSAGPGIDFYNATPVINSRTSPAGLKQDGTAGNGIALATLSKTPVTTAEQTVVGQAVSDTRAFSAWLYGSALGRTSIDSGMWTFNMYAAVNSVLAGRVTTVTSNIFQVVPASSGSVTITGEDANSRTATITSSQFAGTYYAASATNTTASYLQTPTGLYQITATTSVNVVTITVPTGYLNESAVEFSVWNKLFGLISPTIVSTGANYALYTSSTAQPAFTIATTDKLGQIRFVTSNNTTNVTTAYNGVSHNTHFTSPLVTLHNNLVGLQGGTSNQYYHLTLAQHTIATQAATTDVSGYLSTTDWDTFNNKANATLNNLSNVAINTSLLSDADNTDALGDGTHGWSDLFLGSGAVINFNNSDVTITHTAGALTYAGASFTLNKTFTDVTGTALTVNHSSNITASATKYLKGISVVTANIDITTGQTNSGYVYGLITETMPEGAGFAGTLATLASSICHYGIYAGTGTINNVYGISLNPFGKTGTIDNLYSIYIATLVTGGTVTNQWAIYSANTASSVFAGNLNPLTNDAAALGTTALSWSDLFLASGGVINWANGDTTLTHSTGTLALVGKMTITKTGLTATAYLSRITSGINNTADVTAYYIGSMIQISDHIIDTTKTNSGYVYGLDSEVHIDNSSFRGTLANNTAGLFWTGIFSCGAGGTITTSKGLDVNVFNNDADGTITNGYGAYISNSGTVGTMTNRYGIAIEATAGAGTLKVGLDIGAMTGASTDSYGIRIGNVSGAGTGNYSIHTGTGLVYHAGHVLIGSTNDYGLLFVANASANGGIHLSPDTSDVGGFINTTGTSELMLSGGARYSSYSAPNFVMVAKGTIACGVYLTGGSIGFWINSGLTAGNTFNQTRIATIDSTTLTMVNGTHVMVGGATLEAGSTNTIGIANGTAPNASVANQVILFSADSGDATATLGLYLEQAVEAIGTFTASHKIKINVNGSFYWLTLDAV